MLVRLPFTRETADFRRFSQAGRDMARWHLGYESVEPWPVAEHAAALALDPAKDFLVQKMTFGRKDKQVDKTTIHYNARITLTGIPLEAYAYVVNGKPALEWIMERYQITVDKDSGLRNDPNDWAIILPRRWRSGISVHQRSGCFLAGLTARGNSRQISWQ